MNETALATIQRRHRRHRITITYFIGLKSSILEFSIPIYAVQVCKPTKEIYGLIKKFQAKATKIEK